MNMPTMAMGIAAMLFGIYTLYVRATHPHKFEKLKAMQDKFGQKPGIWIHAAFYTIIPMIFGAAMLFAGFMGVSIL